MTIHVVPSGDTLWRIASLYGVPIQSVIEDNGLTAPYLINPGLALYISTGLQSRLHTVAPGDMLWRIAQTYDTTIQAILDANKDLDPNRLFIGQQLVIPNPPPLSMQTVGFVVPPQNNTVPTNFDRAANHLSYVAVVAYSLTEVGYVYIEVDDTAILNRSKETNITPLLMVRNMKGGDFSAELIGRVLENPTYRRNFILSLLNFLQQKGYGGVSIDFEFIPPPRRNDFNTFLLELKQALGDYFLHVSVHAKTEDIPTNRIIGAYDYKAIGEIADSVAIMTMDYGYPTGPADPVAPLWWVEQVVQYAVQLIPPSKMQIAIPFYGYSWRLNTTITKAYSAHAAQNIATTTGAIIRYDAKAEAPWYLYWRGSEGNIMWFGDIRSIKEKYNLIGRYNLQGVTYWHIGLEFPQNWAYMRDAIRVVK
jgi:spore germination protein